MPPSVKPAHEAPEEPMGAAAIRKPELARHEGGQFTEERPIFDDRFDPAELTERFGPMPKAEAASLHAAERCLDTEVVHEDVVHAHAARLQTPGDVAGAARVS